MLWNPRVVCQSKIRFRLIIRDIQFDTDRLIGVTGLKGGFIEPEEFNFWWFNRRFLFSFCFYIHLIWFRGVWTSRK